MSIGVIVKGGTGAGRKRPPELNTWQCCGKTLTAYSCECGQRRPPRVPRQLLADQDDTWIR